MAERKIEYQTLENKMDTGFQVTAPSWERLFIDAALALTDQMVKLDIITEKDKKTLTVTASSLDTLMASWLSAVLGLLGKERFLCHRILFHQFDGKTIGATLWGETYEPVRHGHITEKKAVTADKLLLGDSPLPEPHFFARVYLSS